MADDRNIKKIIQEADKQGFLGSSKPNILFCKTLNSANKILNLVGENPEISTKELAEILKFNRCSALTYLRELERLKYVKSSQVGPRKFWRLEK